MTRETWQAERGRELLVYAVAVLTLCGIVAATQGLLSLRARIDVPSIPVAKLFAFHLAQWYTWIPAVAPALVLDAALRRRSVGRTLRIVSLVPTGVVAILLHSAGVIAVDFLFFAEVMSVTPAAAFASHLRTVALVEVLAYLGLIGAWYAATNAWAARTARADAALLEAGLARAEMQVLHARLQPHFLFNALQAVATINGRSATQGTQALVELASLYRSVLATSGRQVQPLEAEIDFLKRYLAIAQLRMGERLRLRFDLDPPLNDAVIPHLILQPLVENALEHGIAPKPGPSELIISAVSEGGSLVLGVRDTGRGLQAGHEEGLGLGITRARLETLYGGDARLDLERADPGTLARLTVPLERAQCAS